MIALVVLLVGCSQWVPAAIGTAPVGAEVRLRLSDAGADSVEKSTGTRRSEVSGELLRWAEDVMVSAQSGAVNSGLRQRIILDVDHIVGIDLREADATRTKLLIGGLAVGIGTSLILTVLKIVEGGSPVPTQLGPNPVTTPAVLRSFGLTLLKILH
jgi:hypothetical protein